jgi:hypothetical protein
MTAHHRRDGGALRRRLRGASRPIGLLVGLMFLVGSVESAAGPAMLRAQPLPPGTPAPAAESPFKRRDVPAEGASVLLGWYGGFGGPGVYCLLSPSAGLYMHQWRDGESETTGCALSVNNDLILRLEEFAPGPDPIVEVRRPDGSTTVLADPNEDGGSLTIQLGDPFGEYTVTASQGTRTASGTFTVQPGLERITRVLPNTGASNIMGSAAGPPGSTFRITMAGFEPHQVVRLRLYRSVGRGTYRFATYLEPVRVNERGEASQALSTAVDDPEGEYVVATEPESLSGPHRGWRTFQIRRSPEAEAWRPDESLDALALAVVEQANRVWASVIAKDGAPISDLECVYDDRWLAAVRGDVQAMRSRGQYRVARQTSPLVVRGAREIGRPEGEFQVEALVSEEWDDRLYNGDGSLARAFPGHVEQRYVIAERHYARNHPRDDSQAAPEACRLGHGWLIVESEVTRSE